MEQNQQNEERANALRKQYGEAVESRAAECRAADDDALIIEGYAAVFDQVTNIGPFREVIDRSAFDGHLEDDVRLLLNHDGAPMARTTNGTLKLTTDDNGLYYRAELVDTQQSRDLHAMIKRGDISQSSFAFTIEKEERQADGVRRVMQVGSILDVSPTTFPAYPTSSATARSKQPDEQKEEQTKPQDMNVDLTLKDLLQLREDYAAKREAIKDDAVKENRDLSDVDVTEMERLAGEVAKYDRQIKVMREDQKLAESAILAGGNTASRSEQREMDKAARSYNLTRAIQQVYRGRQLTGLEAEMTEEANREAMAAGLNFRGQLSIPAKMLTRAAGTAGDFYTSDEPGSAFMPTQVGTAVEALRADNVLEQAGITVLNGLTADLKIPKMTGATITEKAEGAAAAISGQNTSSVTLQPRRATAFTLLTEQVMMQGGPAVEALVIRDLADATRAFIENKCFEAILDGIATDTNAIETALDAAATVELALEASLIADGVQRSAIRAVANGTAHKTLAAGVEATGVTGVMDRAANTLLGYPYLVGGNCPDDATPTNEYGGGVLIMGDFARGAALGYFGGVDVVINPYTFDVNNQIRVSIHRHFDCDVLQAGALHARYNDGA